MDGTNFEHLGMNNDFVHVLDYDAAEGSIYYGDYHQKKIKKMRSNGDDATDLIWSNLEKLQGLAFDWVTKSVDRYV